MGGARGTMPSGTMPSGRAAATGKAAVCLAPRHHSTALQTKALEIRRPSKIGNCALDSAIQDALRDLAKERDATENAIIHLEDRTEFVTEQTMLVQESLGSTLREREACLEKLQQSSPAEDVRGNIAHSNLEQQLAIRREQQATLKAQCAELAMLLDQRRREIAEEAHEARVAWLEAKLGVPLLSQAHSTEQVSGLTPGLENGSHGSTTQMHGIESTPTQTFASASSGGKKAWRGGSQALMPTQEGTWQSRQYSKERRGERDSANGALNVRNIRSGPSPTQHRGGTRTKMAEALPAASVYSEPGLQAQPDRCMLQ